MAALCHGGRAHFSICALTWRKLGAPRALSARTCQLKKKNTKRVNIGRTECPEPCKRNTLPEPKQYPEAPGDERAASRTEAQRSSGGPGELVDSCGELVEEHGESHGARDIEETFCGVSLEEMSGNGCVDVFDQNGRGLKLGALLALFVLRPVADQPGECLRSLRRPRRRVALRGFRGLTLSHARVRRSTRRAEEERRRRKNRKDGAQERVTHEGGSAI